MELHIILLFMIVGALVAVEAKDLISSLTSLSTVGLGLSFAFLILKAPSLAITQLVVEILCIIILIRGTISRDLPLAKDGRWLFNTVSTLAFLAVFLIFAFFTLKELPGFGEPIMRVSKEYIAQTLNNSGSLSVTSAITSHFRSLDALVEAAVLFCAIIGVLAITRKTGRADGE